MTRILDQTGAAIGYPRFLQFTGDGVSVARNGATATVTISGGAGGGVTGPATSAVGDIAVYDVTDGTSLTAGALPWIIVTASGAPEKVRRMATYVCDGTADEVQINAALALDDKRPVLLIGPTFNTIGPIQFADGIKHDLIGSNPDYTEIRANHTGNVVEVHSAELPQEWRCTIDGLFLNKGATLTPARGLSLVNCAYVTFRNVRVRGCTTGLHQDFALLNTFHNCTINDCPVGTTLTGSVNAYSNANKYFSCAWRNNDVDIDFVARTEGNSWHGCNFEDHGTNDRSIRVANDSTIRSHAFTDCWWEVDPAATGFFFFEFNGGRRFTFERPRFALASTQQVVKVAGFNGRGIKIFDYHVSDGRSLDDLPAGISLSEDPSRWFFVDGFDALGDGAQDDTDPIQRAVDAAGAAGGTISGPLGTYIVDYTGAIAGLSGALNYAIKVDETHGPITFDFPPGTVFKLKAAQSVKNVALIVVGGQSGAYRTAPTIIRNITFDGNYGSGHTPASDDFGLVTTIYTTDVLFDNCNFKLWNFAGAHVLRDSTRVKFSRCYWDGTFSGVTPPAEITKPALRIEVHDVHVDSCRFITDALAGQHHITMGDNADVDLQGRFMRITNNLFAGGGAGYMVDLGGVTHCIVTGNVFRDVCDLTGYALRLNHYTNPNGTYWEGAYNVVQGNVFYNVRCGILLAGYGAALAGTNATTGAFLNHVKNNTITRSLDTLRTQIGGGGDTYPDIYQAAPNATQVNLSIGIQESGNDLASGTATSGAAGTLTNSGAGMTSNAYQNYLLVITGGTGKGQWRVISSHTATVFTVNQNWNVVPDNTSTYRVTNLVGLNEICGNIIDVTTTAGVGIQSTAWLPSTFKDNRVFGTTGANSFQFGTATNSPNAIFSGNKGYAGSPGIASPYGHIVYADEGSGTGTIASGATTVTITHGLGRTPSAQQLRVLMTNSPTNDPGYLYVTSIGATTFDVGCRADPGAGGATFAWAATGGL